MNAARESIVSPVPRLGLSMIAHLHGLRTVVEPTRTPTITIARTANLQLPTRDRRGKLLAGSVSMRSGIALVVVFGCTATPGVAPPGVRVWESPENSCTTEGEPTLDLDPDTAYTTAV